MEVDVVMSYGIGDKWSPSAAYAQMTGCHVLAGEDTRWAFGQVAFKN